MRFKKATFDEQKYHQKKEELTKWAAKVNELRERLSQEGLPTDREFITKITDNEMEFDKWIKEEYKSYLDRLGFVPQAERKRILENFNTLFFDINPFVQAAMTAIDKGILLNPDGTVNEKKIEELAREAGTTVYDTEAMASFYEVVEKARKAIAEVREHEEKNGLSTHFTIALANPNGILLPPRITTFKGGEEEFQRDYGNYFTEKKANN